MIDLDTPDFEVKISTLKSPYAIASSMTKNKTTAYAYEFVNVDPVTGLEISMKIGESSCAADELTARSRVRYGERLYRQIENLPGWGKYPKGSSGSEMRTTVIPAFEEQTGIKVHKDNVRVKVWDLTKEAQQWDIPSRLTHNIESALMKKHVDIHKVLPPGNFKGPEEKSHGNPTPNFRKHFQFDSN